MHFEKDWQPPSWYHQPATQDDFFAFKIALARVVRRNQLSLESDLKAKPLCSTAAEEMALTHKAFSEIPRE